VFGWSEQLKEANQQIAEVGVRVSALKEQLKGVADAARVQRVLAVREQQLARLKIWARFIEEKIACGHREAKPIPYANFALICFHAADRVAQGDAAKTLRALGSTFTAKVRAGNKEPQPVAPGPARGEPTHRAGLDAQKA
jgi:hypothetical protein